MEYSESLDREPTAFAVRSPSRYLGAPDRNYPSFFEALCGGPEWLDRAAGCTHNEKLVGAELCAAWLKSRRLASHRDCWLHFSWESAFPRNGRPEEWAHLLSLLLRSATMCGRSLQSRED